MALQQYNYSSGALDNLRGGNITPEETVRAIKYVLHSNTASFELLKERLWKTEEQKKKAIHKVLRHSQQAYLMLTDRECFQLLSPNEIQIAIWVAIEEPHYAHQTLATVNILNEKQRIEALETVTLHQNSTLNLLTDKKVSKENRYYIMERVIDNPYLLDSFFKTIKETHGKDQFFNDEVRKLAFDKIFQTKSSDTLFWFATKKYYLYENELEILYNKYHQEYYEKHKLKFYDYYDFCSIFNKWLKKEYRERMAKKIMTKTHWDQCNSVCKNVTFSQDIMDKLEAYKMIEQFKQIGA